MQCVYCGEETVANRVTRKWCSTTCRVRAWGLRAAAHRAVRQLQGLNPAQLGRMDSLAVVNLLFKDVMEFKYDQKKKAFVGELSKSRVPMGLLLGNED